MGAVRLKRHRIYRALFKYVDEQPPYGIMQYRWGDAPIHTLGVWAVMASEGWASCFFSQDDVPYVHGGEKLPLLTKLRP
jgi:hypothetical protein